MRPMFLTIVAILGSMAGAAQAGPRDAMWNQVNEAIQKGLPKTAIESLDLIYARAMADKAYAEAIKAIGMKIALEGDIEGNKAEEKILRLQAQVDQAPPPMRPAMEAILAHWYWQYFQQNRWRFLQRTQTAQSPGPDLQTWDLARILAEIDRHFRLALADEQTLKATPVSTYDDLLVKGSLPDAYRPTMYDFLAQEALQFYSAGEQGATAAEDTFVLTADGPIFAPVAEFLAWQPQSTDPNWPTVKAVRLYQSLLAFHQKDQDKTALLDVDLARLTFGHNQATGEDKDDRYKAGLRRFVEESADHDVCARALHEWAQVLHSQGELAAAHKLARRGLDTFAKNAGASLCFNLIQEIEARSASIETERVWNEPLPDIRVTYRNVAKVYFRAVPMEFGPYVESRQWGLYSMNDGQWRDLLARKPLLEWSANLPATADYRERTERLTAPKGLRPGFYFILASHDPSFGDKDNQVTVAPVWVSDLALVVRDRHTEGAVEGLALRALTGDPVAGARVRTWVRDPQGRYRPGQATNTDENGGFRIPSQADRSMVILVEHHGHQLATYGEHEVYRSRGSRPGTKTVFFTDRCLYRPGQSVYYKGICLRYDQDATDYETLSGQRVTVVFSDTNHKEIARAEHRCNDYGAFSGSFTAPQGRVTGQATIEVVNGPSGSTRFRVEEYKRPKFQVQVDPPKEAPRLNAEVALRGQATAYTGAAIGNAKVRWRVVREVRWPVWWHYCFFWRLPQRTASQAIAHGTAVTAADGSFTISLVARPDPAVTEKEEPTFEFTAYADVTDSTGETRSGQRTVRAGFTALQAALDADPWQTVDKAVEMTVETKSLDGEAQQAEGTVRIYGLRQPARVVRADLEMVYRPWDRWRAPAAGDRPKPDPADPNSWELGDLVVERAFKTDANGVDKVTIPLKAGVYRGLLETRDRFGRPVTAQLPVQVIDPKARAFPVKVPNCLAAAKWTLEPGQSMVALWGTGYDKGRALVEIECNGKVLRRYWTAADRTQEKIEQAVTDQMRGGFTLRVTYVRENRAYLNERIVDVPWTNKQLSVRWEHFTSRLEPEARQSWTAVVTGPDTQRAVAEMVAGMYDASLDQFLPHKWITAFDVFRREQGGLGQQFENSPLAFEYLFSGWRVESRDVDLRYRAFPPEITASLPRVMYFDKIKAHRGPSMAAGNGRLGEAAVAMEADVRFAPSPAGKAVAPGLPTMAAAEATGFGGGSDLAKEQPPAPDLGQVSARKNLNETAFFYPHLVSDANGVVRMEFTCPEALTQWRFMGFAHDQQLRSGFLTDTAVTAKDLMVEPNPPRFVREGDVIEFTVKVSNQSATRQTGKVRLTLADARTLESRDVALGNLSKELDFDVPAKESRTYSWRLAVPDGCGFLTYKAVGATDRLSDGEEGPLPVLSRRILVTESLPLPVRGRQTKQFEFTKLLESGQSDTLRHQSLTVQMVSQPAWYAVMALPYLMEYPYECSEQVFNRLYANALARHIAGSDPKIRRIFDLWKATPSLDSPLEKNQDLKAVALEETPWYRQARAESQARRDVGILFDENRLNDEIGRALTKLTQMQLEDGLWPWFPGCRGNEYITLYIVTGSGRLRHLGVTQVDVSPVLRSLDALDNWVDQEYRSILKHGDKDKDHLSATIALYLYGRSFFLEDKAVEGGHREALDYWLGQGRQYWLSLSRQSQAHLAVGLKRFGDKDTPAAIMRSIKERSVSSEEMGMYWRDLERSWWWYRAPIETQAMMIEAFDEVSNDTQAVEDCKVWLLKQKQTQDWRTTKATADAIYGLLVRGTNLLASDALVEVSLAGRAITPEKVEAGTGFYEERFQGSEIQPAMGHVTVKKTDEGVSWGSVHWQYLEDLSKVTPYEGTPLQLKKTLFIKDTTRQGQVLRAIEGPLAVGDELVVRIELRVDRDMEYVHMQDQRGSGTEPVNVLSQYRFQDGLGYYQSTRDTATHFFMDYLPKGVYVFEYSTRIQLRGRYQTGIASIQCMYAPEFNSHSQGFELEVR